MTEFDPDKIYKTLVETGEDWVDKEGAAYLLEENKKNFLASLMVHHLEKGKSVASSETLARASSEYQEYIKNMSDTRKEANRAKVKYDSLRVLASLRQSEHVTRREEMKFV